MPSSAPLYSTIPVTKANDVPHIILISPSCPNFSFLAEVGLLRVARPRKPAAIDVYRVTVSRDYGSLHILRECRIGAASIFVRLARSRRFFLASAKFLREYRHRGERGWYVSTYYRVFLGTESEQNRRTDTPLRIYFRGREDQSSVFPTHECDDIILPP